jgi:toxin CcdB
MAPFEITQFDVFPNPSKLVRANYPFVVVLQSDVAANRIETVVAPIAPSAKVSVAGGRLLPGVTFDDRAFTVVTNALTTVPTGELKRPVANLSAFRSDLLGAIDLLFFGV